MEWNQLSRHLALKFKIYDDPPFVEGQNYKQMVDCPFLAYEKAVGFKFFCFLQLIELMFLELDLLVYSSFDRSVPQDSNVGLYAQVC